MTSPLIWKLSHPLLFRLRWEVKLPEPLLQERALHTGAVPFIHLEHARHMGVVPDWPLPGLVVVVTAVVEVGEVVVVPHVVDPDEGEDEDDHDHDDLNPLPRCIGPRPDLLNKQHHEGRLEP